MPSRNKSAATPAEKKAPTQPALCPGSILDQLRALLADMEMAADPADPQPPQVTSQARDTTVILRVKPPYWSALTAWPRNVTSSGKIWIKLEADSETESGISTAQHNDAFHTLQRTIQILAAKSDDAENRLMRINVKWPSRRGGEGLSS